MLRKGKALHGVAGQSNGWALSRFDMLRDGKALSCLAVLGEGTDMQCVTQLWIGETGQRCGVALHCAVPQRQSTVLHCKGMAWHCIVTQRQSINSRVCLPEGKAKKDEKHY